MICVHTTLLTGQLMYDILYLTLLYLLNLLTVLNLGYLDIIYNVKSEITGTGSRGAIRV